MKIYYTINMTNENIVINIDEDFICQPSGNDGDEKNELEDILKEINSTSLDMKTIFNNYTSETEIMMKIVDYNLNYNTKQLLLICEYYGLLKEIKINKMKKLEIIYFLLDFEEDLENYSIVCKRKQLWYFINELKNDKFMKKFILW